MSAELLVEPWYLLIDFETFVYETEMTNRRYCRALVFISWALFLLTASPRRVEAREPGDAQSTDVWIFSGQSNMQKIGGAVQRAVGNVVENHSHQLRSIYVAAPGKPIEAWLDPEHRDHRLWLDLLAKIKEAKKSGARFAGFVWYQGESSVNEKAGRYQSQLAELIKRIRKQTGEPELPVIVVQIASATGYSGRDWAVATIREAQRRVANDDGNVALVAAIDAEIGDYTVHLSSQGAEVVSQRIASAADRLVYGNREAYWGPQFEKAWFADEARRSIIVQFNNVKNDLKLGDGFLAGFGVSQKTLLPDSLEELKNAVELGDIRNDFIYPASGRAIGEGRLLLTFHDSLAKHSRLSYAAARNAQYGPHRRWKLAFKGLVDGSNNQAPAFVLQPIESKGEHVALGEVIGVKPPSPHAWKQIAVNCIGRFAAGATKPTDVAGIGEHQWRQPFWNPASSGLAPDLFDADGKVTNVNFHTGVWYMSPYFKEIENADRAMMASWCKNSVHGFSGLSPEAKYDLAVYLLQGPPKQSDRRPVTRPVRVTIMHIPEGKKPLEGKIVARQIVNVPASGLFEKYRQANSSNEFTGNVLILKDLPTSVVGAIELTIETNETKNGKFRWIDTTLAGLQLSVAP